MSQALKGLWQLLQWRDDHLPKLIALEELGPAEVPAVPYSLHTELLDRDWPDEEVSCTCFQCGTEANLPKPRVSLRQSKPLLSNSTVQAEPEMRQPAACSQVRDRSFSQDLCARWCGEDLAGPLRSRPSFGRPPAHAGPDDREECDSCARMWCDPPSPLADAQLEDAADGNRQTVKPKFWWRDLDDEEGLDALVRQVHMQEEAPMVMQGEAPHSGARSPQSMGDALPLPSSSPKTPNSGSPYSLNGILHKPGTRSPSVNQHVTFTMAIPLDQKPPRPTTPSRKPKAAPKRDNAVLWHLIPGT